LQLDIYQNNKMEDNDNDTDLLKKLCYFGYIYTEDKNEYDFADC